VFESGVKPNGRSAWILTIAACLLFPLMGFVAYAMAKPVSWNGPGKLGAIALLFPLHLLVVSIVTAALAFLAWRARALIALLFFVATSLLTIGMALAPTMSMWEEARRLNVNLSLRDYAKNALHLNRGSPQQDRSVVYGATPDGTKLVLDVWKSSQPNTEALRPAVVIVHGGAWNHGNRSETPDWNRWLNELGYQVFDVEYQMPPPARWLDEVGDVKAALAWVAANAATYRVDTSRISIMGRSAGGNLSMLAAYSKGSPQLPPTLGASPVRIRAVINLYGPSDIPLLYRISKSAGYVRPNIQRYIGGTPQEFPDRYRAVSPLTYVSASSPPTIMILGTSDRLVSIDQAIELDDALTKAGATDEMFFLPATDHGFDANWGGFGTQIARQKVKDFLRRYEWR